jgi:hypothetical protein
VLIAGGSFVSRAPAVSASEIPAASGAAVLDTALPFGSVPDPSVSAARVTAPTKSTTAPIATAAYRGRLLGVDAPAVSDETKVESDNLIARLLLLLLAGTRLLGREIYAKFAR